MTPEMILGALAGFWLGYTVMGILCLQCMKVLEKDDKPRPQRKRWSEDEIKAIARREVLKEKWPSHGAFQHRQ